MSKKVGVVGDAKAAAELAINAIGLGYDLAADLKLKSCKTRLVPIDHHSLRTVDLPGRITIPNVPKSINCDKGERTRLCSDVLSFQQMSEQFNQELSLSGKIPTGHFNAAFEFTGAWQKDAASTKSLAFDGVSIALYNFALEKTQVVLGDFVKQAVPSSWDPAALAKFINEFGTHVIVGVKIGGTDIIYAKQQYSSSLQPAEVQKTLREMADKLFIEQAGLNKFDDGLGFDIPSASYSESQVNKPQIDELHQFLEFQLPRQWAPVFGELALGPERKPRNSASLQFSFMGPKLYVNTTPVDVGKKPVTGLRLYLEGKRSNCLAIHLQHLSSMPKTFQLEDEPNGNVSDVSLEERKYYEKVQWKSFSHVCTVPVQSEDDTSIVTGAHFEVGEAGLKSVLFLRLHFSKVVNATQVKAPQWDDPPGFTQKSGIISTLISTHFSGPQKPPPPRPSDVNINSALYPAGPPVPTQTPKLLRFVDTTEMTRGPQDLPGYWVVSGARLVVDKGKISLKVRYSLLTAILPDEEVAGY
ncbi:hypothetical protein Ahy_A03g012263 isoform B [Arachis hypogaea]|uniref:MACPF domain-containing protein n=1 Tax=Arachis hypogaea TaxID=3818 RepID=A0A445DSX6_ARAHY|nr:hypothetical protein Ahy_A03g012263 isoform B [Arachis hypogaea]